MGSPDATWTAPLADRTPRAWTLWAAARPSQVGLVLLVYLLGVGMATAGPPLTRGVSPVDPGAPESRLAVVAGAAALVSVTVAVHYANEYADVETDAMTDRTPFSGGSGALAHTGLPPAFLRSATIGATAVAAATLAGLRLADHLAVDALALLLAILVAGLAYSLPPVALVRRGVGEAVNAALGGLLLPLYGVAVVAEPTPAAALAVVPFTLLVGCNLLATHWPDREADAAVGKRTLAVRWSPRSLRRTYAALAAAAGVTALWLWLDGVVPPTVAGAHLVPGPLLVWGGHVLTRQRSPLPAALAMVSLAVASTVAWWWVGVVS